MSVSEDLRLVSDSPRAYLDHPVGFTLILGNALLEHKSAVTVLLRCRRVSCFRDPLPT